MCILKGERISSGKERSFVSNFLNSSKTEDFTGICYT